MTEAARFCFCFFAVTGLLGQWWSVAVDLTSWDAQGDSPATAIQRQTGCRRHRSVKRRRTSGGQCLPLILLLRLPRFLVLADNPVGSGARAGYLVLPFPRDSSFFDDRFDMRVLVRDRKDNRSEAVTLPLRIGHWTYEEVSEKWEKVADNRLGTIMLDLESSHFYNRGADNSRPAQ